MSIYVDYLNGEGSLQHHGVKGQKWGIRRYQPYPTGQKLGKEIGEATKLSKKSKDVFKSKKSHDPSTNLYESSTVSSGGAAGASPDEEELETINNERMRLMAELQSVEFEPDPDPEVQADSENKQNILRERIKELDRKRDKILEKIRNARKESSELQHHGVLGMKWGIRRYQPYPKSHAGGKEIGEAAKRKTQKKNAKEFSKILKKKRSPERDEKVVSEIRISGDSELRKKTFEARDELRKFSKIENDFWNTDLHDKYSTKRAERLWDSGNHLSYENVTKEQFVQLFKEGENRDDGPYSSFAEYLEDIGIDYWDYGEKYTNAMNKYDDAIKRYTDDLLGDFGNRTIKNVDAVVSFDKKRRLNYFLEREFNEIEDLKAR